MTADAEFRAAKVSTSDYIARLLNFDFVLARCFDLSVILPHLLRTPSPLACAPSHGLRWLKMSAYYQDLAILQGALDVSDVTVIV